MEWTAKAIDLLRGLWAEGHSTAEIGRRMGVTKNAIVGKAHRLDLPARPRPTRPQDTAGAPAPGPRPRRNGAPHGRHEEGDSRQGTPAGPPRAAEPHPQAGHGGRAV